MNQAGRGHESSVAGRRAEQAIRAALWLDLKIPGDVAQLPTFSVRCYGGARDARRQKNQAWECPLPDIGSCGPDSRAIGVSGRIGTAWPSLCDVPARTTLRRQTLIGSLRGTQVDTRGGAETGTPVSDATDRLRKNWQSSDLRSSPQRRYSCAIFCIARTPRRAVVPAKAGTHTPCPLDGLRRMGPGFGRDDAEMRLRERHVRGNERRPERFTGALAGAFSGKMHYSFRHEHGQIESRDIGRAASWPRSPRPRTAPRPAPAMPTRSAPRACSRWMPATHAARRPQAVSRRRCRSRPRRWCSPSTTGRGPVPPSAFSMTLRQECVRATFFLIGRNAQAHPALAQRELARGPHRRLSQLLASDARPHADRGRAGRHRSRDRGGRRARCMARPSAARRRSSAFPTSPPRRRSWIGWSAATWRCSGPTCGRATGTRCRPTRSCA